MFFLIVIADDLLTRLAHVKPLDSKGGYLGTIKIRKLFIPKFVVRHKSK